MNSVLNIISENKKTFIALASFFVLFILAWVIYKFFVANSMIESFENLKVGADKPEFRMFYVDWCPHCQVAKPEFQKITHLKEINGVPIHVEMINAEENPELAKQFDVSSYPTIILSMNGKNIPYEGERSENGFHSFLKDNVV